MKTEFGELTIGAVVNKIEEYREVGRKEFLRKYANSRDSKNTWISFEGDLYPAKAIYAASLKPRRSPAEFNTSDTYVFSEGLGLELIRVEDGLVQSERSAINDLDEFNAPELPEQKDYSGKRYVRDAKVRNAVLERAQGRCEYCEQEGFVTSKGRRYLETHHIISLSNQGPDSLENVIALCPLDHRRAHFADNAAELETEFLKRLSSIQAKK